MGNPPFTHQHLSPDTAWYRRDHVTLVVHKRHHGFPGHGLGGGAVVCTQEGTWQASWSGAIDEGNLDPTLTFCDVTEKVLVEAGGPKVSRLCGGCCYGACCRFWCHGCKLMEVTCELIIFQEEFLITAVNHLNPTNCGVSFSFSLSFSFGASDDPF